MTDNSTIIVAALYQFATFPDREAIAEELRALCHDQMIKGTLLIAHEGINGTIAGAREAIEAVVAHIRTLPGCADIEVKYSQSSEPPFQRMKVRLKNEIVTMGVADIDPVGGAGEHLDPQAWNDLLAEPGTILIDTRNDYEVAIGSFKNAIDPDTRSFREFPEWFDRFAEDLDPAHPPKIAMFCTGGIRCEKATAYVKAKGFDAVYHLEGGVLKYLEQVPEADSQWEGECYVFDERVAVTHGLEQGTHIMCKPCGRPLSPQDLKSADYQDGVSCPYCVSTKVDQRDA